MNDQTSPSGLWKALTADVAHLLATLSERYRLETMLTEHEDTDKRHRVAKEGLKRIGPASAPERHILDQLAWLHGVLHQRDLDGLKVKSRVNVTLRDTYRPSLGCSSHTFTGVVSLIERDQFSGHVQRLLVRNGGQTYELKGAELKDVRPFWAAD